MILILILSVFIFGASEYGVRTGMVNYWRFNEGSGSIAYDEVGNNNTTIYGSAWVSGKFGYGVHLNDNANSYIKANIPNLDWAGNFSYCIWIYLEQRGNEEYVLDTRSTHYASDGTGIALVARPSYTWIGAKNSSYWWIEAQPVIPTNRWVFLCLVFDRTNSQVRYYLDGELQNTYSIGTGSLQPNGNLILGNAFIGWDGGMKGTLDETAFFNYALSNEDVKELYEGKKPMFVKEEIIIFPVSKQYGLKDKMIAYWQMNEGSGNSIFDLTSYDNDGTIYGCAWTSGKFHSALSFDGINDYVSLPSNIIKSSNNFTIALWFKRNRTGKEVLFCHLLGYALVVRTWYGYSTVPDNSIGVYMETQPSGAIGVGSPDTVITDNNWHHFIIVKRSDGDGIEMWLDGNKISNLVYEYGEEYKLDDLRLSSFYNEIGAYHSTSRNQYFQGKIDEVAIFNRTLSDIEIKNLYKKKILLVEEAR